MRHWHYQDPDTAIHDLSRAQIIGNERFLFFNLEAYPYVLDTPSLIQSLIDEHRAPEVVQIGRTALLESALDEPAPWGTL